MNGENEMVLWALLVIGSITDLVWGKLYNSVNFSFLGSGLLVRFLFDSRSGIEATSAVAFAMILFLPLYRLKVISAGDVKLLMAFGAWAHTQLVIQAALLSIVFGGVVGAIVLFRQVGMSGGMKSVIQHVKPLSDRLSHRMPFAPALLCAFILIKIGEMNKWV